QTLSTISMVDIKKGIMGHFELPYIIFTGSQFIRDSNGVLWALAYVGEESTVIKLNPGKMTYQELDSTTSLNNERYFQVIEDGEKNTWLSSRSGIDIILKGTNKVVTLGKVNGLSNDTIRAMTLGPDGRMWVSWPNGVDAIDLKRGKIT